MTLRIVDPLRRNFVSFRWHASCWVLGGVAATGCAVQHPMQWRSLQRASNGLVAAVEQESAEREAAVVRAQYVRDHAVSVPTDDFDQHESLPVSWFESAESETDSWMHRVKPMVRLPPVYLEGIDPADVFAHSWHAIGADHANFYSVNNFTLLTAGFAAGALMANTGFDEHFIRHNYLRNVVNISNDDFYESIHQPHFLGDGRYTLPVFAMAALSEQLFPETVISGATTDWGRRSLRTILVGSPPMLAAQLLTGASRPGESTLQSKWKPFQDSNGVSGHSFMGAVPFLSAAKMTDRPWLKAGLYVLSMAPALSRVNDDKHYFSQAFLGWWMAYAAATAVDNSYQASVSLSWGVTPVGDGMGIGMTYLR